MKQDMSATELKDLGNKFFSARKYEDAISCYSKAIIKSPSTSTYFTNRALCYLKLHQWELACQDCRRSLDLDASSVKAHFFLGQALLELDSCDEAVKYLQRVGSGGSPLYADLALRWRATVVLPLSVLRTRSASISRVRLLHTCNAHAWKVQEMKMKGARQMDVDKVENTHEKYMSELNNIFAKNDDKRRKRDVPDYLCGKISFEIMREPVITPSGITYDRRTLRSTYRKKQPLWGITSGSTDGRVGHFDPVTRTPLTQDQLVPNLAMKEVVDAFLVENEWALDY
ncbi:hypothetical protein HPB47_005003 [Ixodes persulcatus]|uniref:Uncharacterized protein n=1 Tax=Ixodes persulcatus TaxID=34615 RepID=A0AC60PF04_IXOPE|nr:hypothetical protein HPB47_005003 [Ixodes persulcatus]